MNIASLLNRQPTLLLSTTRLTSLVLKNNRQEIESKSLLLKKRKETSKQRIKTFAALQADVNRGDTLNNALLGGGLLAGGGSSLLRGRKGANNIRPFRKPIKPGRFSGLGRISKGSVITNTLFAGLDFANRKSAGQTNLQAGLGAGGGAERGRGVGEPERQERGDAQGPAREAGHAHGLPPGAAFPLLPPPRLLPAARSRPDARPAR